MMTNETNVDTAADTAAAIAPPVFDYAAWQATFAMETAERNARLIKKRRALCTCLARAGAANVTAEYSGCGDSGSTYSAEAFAADNTVVTLSAKLQHDVDEFIDDFISANAGGYENNDGGGGTVTITVATKEIEAEHYDNVVEQVHRMFSL